MPIGITLTESERVGTPTFVSTKLEYLLRKEGYLRYLWEAKPTRKTGNCKRGGAPTLNRVLAQDLDEPCSSSPGVVLCGFYGVHTDKIYRRIGGFRVVVMQKHAETRSKCHFEAI